MVKGNRRHTENYRQELDNNIRNGSRSNGRNGYARNNLYSNYNSIYTGNDDSRNSSYPGNKEFYSNSDRGNGHGSGSSMGSNDYGNYWNGTNDVSNARGYNSYGNDSCENDSYRNDSWGLD